MMVGWITRTFDARLPAGGFLRHAFAVSSGVVVSQGITILSTPIITRIYSPSVYGTVITLVASSSILAVIAPFSFQVAISIARDDDEALSLAAIALVLATLFTSFVTIVFLVLPQDVLASVGFDPQLYGLRWLIPVMVITGTYQTVISQFGTYRRAYAALASASATQAIVSGGVKIALGLIAPVAGSLIVGELARRSVGTGLIARRSGLRVHDLLARSTPRRIRATARAFRRYPAFVLPSSLLNTISLQAPVVLLAANFSTVESGLYALGVGVVQLPLSLLQSGVSSAFVSRIREYESTDSLAEVITKMVQVLALLTAPWFALCAVWGPDFMAVVFGAAWRESGTYLALLTPWLFIGFVFSGCSMVLWARDRQGADFGWQVMFVTLRLGALELGSRLGSAVAAVASYAAVSFVVLTAYNVWLLRLIKVGLAGTLAYALRELAGYFLICFAVKYAFLQTGIASPLASAVAAAPLVGLLALWRLRAHPGLRTLWQP